MWKPLVDFSWNVISERQIGLKASNDKNECLFVDMAEIWEAFLRKRLGERLADDGWRVWNSDEALMRVYSGVQFMSRDIIPDIVLQRLNDGIDEFLVFDAKYKRMKNRDDEVDRSDFFQIHTYIHYFQHCYPNGRVLVGGLLYPLYRNEKTTRKYSSMFGRSGRFDTKFIVDGIVCEGIGESDNDFDVEINTLINNIKNSYR
jgi:5-methylcytosine-specific restriction endonuclease McrBC regulatory subunit McrC